VTAAPRPEAISSHPLAPTAYVVRRRTVETSDTTTLVLAPAKGALPPTHLPGQFNMVYLYGIGEAAISIAGDPLAPNEIVHTVRAAGKVTNALAQLEPGSAVGVRGPYGTGWPLGKAAGHDVVIVAGGLGLPPLRGVLHEIFEHRERYGRVEIIYGARSPRDLVYYAELQAWRARPDIRFQTTVDAAGRDWYGDVGLVTARIPDARFDPANAVAFLCGPEIMMKLTAQALEARGIRDDAIWVSMERNMKCAIGLCGHCQFGPEFVCRDGPVFAYRDVRRLFAVREV